MAEEDTNSVSKGVFVFKKKIGRSKKDFKTTTSETAADVFSHKLWYEEYTALWSYLDEEFETLTSSVFSTMTADLLEFIKTSHQNVVQEIPTAALLTGINMPDHESQFKSLEMQVKTDITPHLAFLKSHDCGNLKYLIENMIDQLINGGDNNSFEEDDDEQQKTHLKKSQLSVPLLQSWYEDLYSSIDGDKSERKLLVVIISEFESFNVKVLKSFILIVSSYIDKLPFVFVFGLATSVTALHSSFSYHVTSKTNIQVFRCEPSTVHLNKMLEGIFLSPYCLFQLGGKVFDLFTEIFLFYDFSVQNFVKNIKFAMMEHFCYGNAMSLCQFEKTRVGELLEIFTHEDCENVRHLMSFRKLVESESPTNQIKLLTDDDYFKQVVFEKILVMQRYIRRLQIFLKCLHSLVADLPGAPLGKNLREVYAIAVTKPITQSAEYKESFQLLNFQSKDELSAKLEKIMNILQQFINIGSKKTQLKDFYSEINRFKDVLNNINNLGPETKEGHEMESEATALSSVMDRKALKEALMSKSMKKQKPLNRYEKFRKEILDFLMQHFEIYLVHYNTMTFHEIFFFDDISIKSKIIGVHRSAIHNALNNPHYYLQCKCCEISNTQTIRATMPDICIAYKLHLEFGKMINLYDWLQAFLCIVDPKEDDDFDDKSKKIVDPELQASFTQAVAELEYLGFIKSSKRKADHVTRLTWEG